MFTKETEPMGDISMYLYLSVYYGNSLCGIGSDSYGGWEVSWSVCKPET